MNDGGPAFPTSKYPMGRINPDGSVESIEHQGLSLRDYFAAKAMQAMVAGDGAAMVAIRDGRYDETNWKQIVSLNAYEFADAMLDIRGKRPQPLMAKSPDVRTDDAIP